ncbi:MAG: EamA family transporter RarD, partial [Fusobacteriaceae bacterium]
MTNDKKGILFSIIAFTMWGLFPLYWKLLKNVPALEIVSNRILWSFIFGFIAVIFTNKKSEFFSAIKNKKIFGNLAIAAIFCTANWLMYIYVVNHDRVLEASLGYFINPILLIISGKFVFKEKLTRNQVIAIFLAIGGVIFMTIKYGKFPTYAILIAATFTVYGIYKKKVQVSS